MHDPFQQIPAPILLMILKLIPDFPSLDHFTQASPIANGIFEELPAEITDALISRLPTDVAKAIQRFSELLSKYWKFDRVPEPGQTQMLEQVYRPSLAEPTQYPLLCAPTLSSVRDLIRVASRIHDITTLFFETYINRLNAMRPMHLVNPSHNFGDDPFVDYPEGRTYTPLQTGPASYVEELRVARALWRLQYYLTFRCDPRIFWSINNSQYPSWESDEMEYVNAFLIDNDIALYPPSPDELIQKASSLSLSPTLKCPPLHSSILAEPPTDPPSKAWRQDTEAANEASPASHFFHSHGQRVPMSPLKNSTWRPFRNLGFGIWDLKRMCALELMDVPEEVPSPGGPYRVGVGIRMSPGQMGFTWNSIIPVPVIQ